MEQRTLELNIISANDLKDVNLVTKMDVYAVVSISGDPNNPKQKAKTNVHRGSGKNPTWNFPIRFTVDESLVQNNRLTLVIKLVCQRSLGDKDVGEVNVPVKDLWASSIDEGNKTSNNSMKFVSYQVRKPSGKAKGELRFSYQFGEKVAGKPVTAYPVEAAAVGPSYPPPPAVASYAGGYPPATAPPQPAYGVAGYQPPPAGYGYGYPPPPPPQHQGYGYPPAPGYGYPPPQQAPKKRNKFGMGLGAGLLGGALGGLLIGDMVSDAAGYDAGYDAGFDDAGGFGF